MFSWQFTALFCTMNFLVLIIKKTNNFFLNTSYVLLSHKINYRHLFCFEHCSHEKQWHSIMLLRLNHSSYSITKSWNVLSELFILKLTGNKNFEAQHNLQYMHSSAWNSLAMALKHEEAISKKKTWVRTKEIKLCDSIYLCLT